MIDKPKTQDPTDDPNVQLELFQQSNLVQNPPPSICNQDY